MKSGQAWGFDLIVALIIFSSGVFFFYFYTLNHSTGSDVSSVSLQDEASLVADSLLTEGYPLDWNSENVIRIGIYENGKINQMKLDEFYEITTEDYEKTKNLFNLKDEFYINFPGNFTIDGESLDSFGMLGNDVSNLVKVSRVVVYENKLRTMEVIVWN